MTSQIRCDVNSTVNANTCLVRTMAELRLQRQGCEANTLPKSLVTAMGQDVMVKVGNTASERLRPITSKLTR